MLHSRNLGAAVLIALGVLSMVTHAATEEPIKKVAVPAVSPKAALKMLAEQSEAEFFYSTDPLEGLRTEDVSGPYTPEQAVQKLLEGANPKLTRHESRALVITVPDEAAAAVAAPGALEEIVVTALKAGAVSLENAPISVTALGGDIQTLDYPRTLAFEITSDF